MSLIIEFFHYMKYDFSWNIKIYLQIALVSTVLTDVKTCFVLLVGPLIIHSPSVENMKKKVFIYVNMFLSEFPLIKTSPVINTWHHCWIPPNYSKLPSPSHLFDTEDYAFQNWSVSCKDSMQEEEAKGQIFGLMCRGARLWSFVGS